MGTLCCLTFAGCGGGGGVDRNNNNSTPVGVSSTLAGGASSGTTDGLSTTASFDNPVNVAVDSAGTVYVCDFDSDRVRRINISGVVSTLTNQANFSRPFGIALTPNGNLYVTTDGNELGQRDATTGTLWQINVSTGAATVIKNNLGRPRGLVALSDTQLVLVDVAQNDVRIINPSTKVITNVAGLRGTAGSGNGTGTAAHFNRPYGAAITPDGNILLADQGNNALRLVTPAGVVTTFAGIAGTAGYREGARAQALFNAPEDVDIDSKGIIYVSDHDNHRIRRIGTDGVVSNFAGDGVAGYLEGAGGAARFYGQEGLAVKRDGSIVYVADGDNGNDLQFNRVRKLIVR